jgi:hypothetical protein
MGNCLAVVERVRKSRRPREETNAVQVAVVTSSSASSIRTEEPPPVPAKDFGHGEKEGGGRAGEVGFSDGNDVGKDGIIVAEIGVIADTPTVVVVGPGQSTDAVLSEEERGDGERASGQLGGIDSGADRDVVKDSNRSEMHGGIGGGMG